MTQRKHGVFANRKALSLTPSEPDERVVRHIDVPGIGKAGYTASELQLVDELKASGADTVLNELAVLHMFKVELDATYRPPAGAPAETIQRQGALFT